MVRRLLRHLSVCCAIFGLIGWLTIGPARADEDSDTFSASEVADAATGFFGATTEGVAKVIEGIFSELGRPNAYIAGEEISGAFVVGLRYGKGDLTIKNGGSSKIFWQGPSVGFDVGGNASKTFVLVYGLNEQADIYKPKSDAEIQAVRGHRRDVLLRRRPRRELPRRWRHHPGPDTHRRRPPSRRQHRLSTLQ